MSIVQVMRESRVSAEGTHHADQSVNDFFFGSFAFKLAFKVVLFKNS